VKAQICDIVPEIQISLNRAKVRANMMEQFIKEMMNEGVDYGVMSGFPKPSLFKSGAEKLADIFGFSKRVNVINRTEDWISGLFNYEIKVTLINKKSGLIEAEGLGSCNSKEKKFKNNDPFTIVNTVLKMAKKRAIVDAVLSATRSSGIFSQDIEDLEIRETNFEDIKKSKEGTKKNTLDKAVTQKQLNLIYNLASKKGLNSDDARKELFDKYGILESKSLNANQASDFINYLQER
jgi:hypothetical protein